MTALRSLVLVLFTTLALYTAITISKEGINFIPGFVGDLSTLGWRGQVNLDFVTYLVLSAVWVAWRHRFSTIGIGLSVVVMVGAMMLFAPYLFYAIWQSKGDVRAFLLGENLTTEAQEP